MWERGVNPSFTDLLKLVDCKARAANSPSGAELQASNSSRSRQGGDNRQRSSLQVKATSTSGSYLGIVHVIVEANCASVQTYALLEHGSDKTLVTDRLVSALGVEGSPVDVTISGVNIDSVPYRGKQVDIKVRPLTGTDVLDVRRAWSVNALPSLNEPLPTRAHSWRNSFFAYRQRRVGCALAIRAP